MGDEGPLWKRGVIWSTKAGFDMHYILNEGLFFSIY